MKKWKQGDFILINIGLGVKFAPSVKVQKKNVGRENEETANPHSKQ